MVRNAWTRKHVVFAESESHVIAKRCKGVPRIALHLSERVLDWCYCQGENYVAPGASAKALEAFGIDERGFDAVDWRILKALTFTFAGRSVGVEALAQAVGIDRSALEMHEGPLVAAGFISRTARGRLALPAAYELAR